MIRREVTDICGAVGLLVTCRVMGFLSSSGQRSVLGKGGATCMISRMILYN